MDGRARPGNKKARLIHAIERERQPFLALSGENRLGPSTIDTTRAQSLRKKKQIHERKKAFIFRSFVFNNFSESGYFQRVTGDSSEKFFSEPN